MLVNVSMKPSLLKTHFTHAALHMTTSVLVKFGCVMPGHILLRGSWQEAISSGIWSVYESLCE